MKSLLIVSIDTLRADCFTPEVMPRLTSLIPEGLFMNQIVAGGSWTVPSHTCLFTGRGPWHFVWRGDPPNKMRSKFSQPTIIGRLKEAGYTTAWWGGDLLKSCRQSDELWGGPGEEGETADGHKHEIVEWLNDTEPPWCLLLHYWDAHAPFGLEHTCLEIGERLVGGKDLRHIKEAYRHQLHKLDREIYDIVKDLDALVLITSDHGEDFGMNHPMQSNFHYAWMHCVAWRDRATVVPGLLLGGPVGKISYQLRNYDLAPTLWELIWGRDLLDASGYPVWEDRFRVAECWSMEWGTTAQTIRLPSGARSTLLRTSMGASILGNQDWETFRSIALDGRDETESFTPGENWAAVEDRLRGMGYFE